jgi:hypothetical protein
MPNAQLTWSQAAVLGSILLAVGLVIGWVSLPWPRLAWVRRLAPFTREVGVVILLYSLWQLVGSLSEHGATGAYARAQWIERTQNSWHLPSEAAMAKPLIEHPWLGQAANVYYATMHFNMLFVCLIWVFFRHRPQYAYLRTTVIGFTALSLVIQLIPVAPPRLLPGFTDVAEHYGQSVYGNGWVSVDELSAMPSVHVGWAVLIAGYVLWLGRGPWRLLGVLHAVITIWVVTATNNHWWFDGLASVLLLAIVVGAQIGWHYARLRRRVVSTAIAEPGVAIAVS